MAESFQEQGRQILERIEGSRTPCLTMPAKNEQFDFRPKSAKTETARTFGEVYLCNEETFGEFFRIQEFDTFKIEKFQGTEDKVFIFFQNEDGLSRIAMIRK